MARITLRTNCCETGKECLSYIPKEDCRAQDIDPLEGAFYIDVSGSYPDPAWEKISYCPFCGEPLVVPLVGR